ncbi:MAG: hypothetical protein ACE5EC_03755 [Phycisphaerae bacterium]
MDPNPLRAGLRRFGRYGVVLLAVILVSMVIWVLMSDDPVYDADEVFPKLVYPNPEKQPQFVFPDDLRSNDVSLNRFVDRFLRACSEGQYSQVRLMLSTKSGDPLLPKRFESTYNVLKEARIRSIKRLPDVPELEGPAYLLTAEYDLEDYAPKRKKSGRLIRLAISREQGEWRIGPVPKEAFARLRAYEAGLAQTHAAVDGNTARPENTSPPSKTAANRPIRLDPD